MVVDTDEPMLPPVTPPHFVDIISQLTNLGPEPRTPPVISRVSILRNTTLGVDMPLAVYLAWSDTFPADIRELVSRWWCLGPSHSVGGVLRPSRAG